MKVYLNKNHIIFGLIAVSILCGCKNKASRAGGDIAEEPIDTLAELAKHIHEYDYISDFWGGYAWVEKNGKIGVVNKAGEIIIDCQFEHIRGFKPPYLVGKKEGGYGIMDYNGNVICDFIYDDISMCEGSFYQGVAIVESESRFGIINQQGRVVVPCKYESISYDDGLLRIKKNGKLGWIDTSGHEVIAAKYKYETGLDYMGFSEGFAAVQEANGNCCGFIDKNGCQITEFKYEIYSTHPFHEGVAVAKECGTDGRWVIINNKGNEYFLPRGVYISEWQFSEGLVPVENLDNNKVGYVNKQGNLVIDYKYKEAKNFSDNLARASYDGRSFGFIDKRGDVVIPFVYGMTWTSDFRNGLAKIEDSRHESDLGYDDVGYIDKKGNIIVSPSDYDMIGRFSEGMCCVLKEGKIGFVNYRGEMIIPCIYDEYLDDGIKGISQMEFSSGLAKVAKNGKIGFVDKQGNNTFDKKE